MDGDKPGKRKFKTYALGLFHVDIAEVRTAEGKLHLFVAIDRVTKFAFVQFHEKATRRIAGDFLRALVKAVPSRVHTVLTDNGTHFTDPPSPGSCVDDSNAPWRPAFRADRHLVGYAALIYEVPSTIWDARMANYDGNLGVAFRKHCWAERYASR